MAADGPVTLAVFDVGGRRVRELVNAVRTAGPYTATWDGRDANGHLMPTGVYFARMGTGERIFGQKLVLIR